MDTLGIDHHSHHQHRRQHQHQHQHHNHEPLAAQELPSQLPRKRKAGALPDNNERLSKRMSLLNLEKSGQKLYVPVESATSSQPSDAKTSATPRKHRPPQPRDDSQMQLDDSKYKVYIYNIDDELSSSDNESDSADAKLVFLPDIEKHLRNSRIPAHLLDPRPDPSEWAGKELVLYREPSSISVPEERDSVRKAILEARARARERQTLERERAPDDAPGPAPAPVMTSLPATSGYIPMHAEPLLGLDEDPDAMDID